jgi:hypothetical protein
MGGVFDYRGQAARMRGAGLARAAQFDWVDIARRTVEVYEAAA